jgi:NAD(P)-dependent dehydrogenase (short-subunit alcohol dehydrogenase family)
MAGTASGPEADPVTAGPVSKCRFGGQVALVTGASRGIGLAIAQRFVDEGAKVCVTARKPDPLAEAVEALGGPEHAIGIAGRADDTEHQESAIAATVSAFGRLDVLVNNTGINPSFGMLLDIDPSAARKTMDVNVLAALAWIRGAYRAWMEEHGGSIVNVASIAGLRPAMGLGMYAVSKAALLHLTAQLAVELGPAIRVNAVAPAVVKTQFARVLYEGREEEVSTPYPLKRLGVPDDVAGAVAFLASSDASWITGHTIVTDGGILLAGGV